MASPQVPHPPEELRSPVTPNLDPWPSDRAVPGAAAFPFSPTLLNDSNIPRNYLRKERPVMCGSSAERFSNHPQPSMTLDL
jgi:hypothetical protein